LEQPLPPYGACLLGSINLTQFVEYPFQNNVRFNYEKLKQVVRIFNRMLDNVVEISGLPLEEQLESIKRTRRHGLGILGLGSMLAMMKIKYDSKEALELAETIMKLITTNSYEVGVELAKEKGAAPICYEKFNGVLGKELISKSKFIRNTLPKGLIEDIEKFGVRYSNCISIAPTGTISFSLANNASNGIEPSFMHSYQRNVIIPGKNTKIQEDIYSYELLVYKELIDLNIDVNNLPDYFQTANSISPKAHIDMLCTIQKWVDSAISKTVNVPTEIPFDDFKDLYMYAYDHLAKGCTTYRYNPDNQVGVLVTKEELGKTKYRIILEDNTEIIISGDKKIGYDGDIHNSSNLCDSIMEGLYGRY
jgi:ribonucleoside-diphosphate reductase alpha chain